MAPTKQVMITYIQKQSTGKTIHEIVICNNISLGEIKWYASWRRYCFFPGTNTLYDYGCMCNIANHISGLMEDRKCKKLNK